MWCCKCASYLPHIAPPPRRAVLRKLRQIQRHTPGCFPLAWLALGSGAPHTAGYRMGRPRPGLSGRPPPMPLPPLALGGLRRFIWRQGRAGRICVAYAQPGRQYRKRTLRTGKHKQVHRQHCATPACCCAVGTPASVVPNTTFTAFLLLTVWTAHTASLKHGVQCRYTAHR